MNNRRWRSMLAPLRAMVYLLLAAPAAADVGEPHEWLDRMAKAVQTINYEGTVIRVSEGRAEAMKVLHTVSDGVVREKLVAQEGSGLEIIRTGNEVHCFLPEDKSVLVEEWNDQSTLFSTLPSSDLRFGSVYDVKIVGRERVAGRAALQLAIKPHDSYRYEHRLWLDVETGFPLQTQVVGEEQHPLEQVKFADISLEGEILSSALQPSFNTQNFKWFNHPRRRVTSVADSDWYCDDLPIGFRLLSAREDTMPGDEAPVTHLLYGDGLASVSVFIVENGDQRVSERSRVGASNSFSRVTDGYRITAVGDVPAITVEKIAVAMQRR